MFNNNRFNSGERCKSETHQNLSDPLSTCKYYYVLTLSVSYDYAISACAIAGINYTFLKAFEYEGSKLYYTTISLAYTAGYKYIMRTYILVVEMKLVQIMLKDV